MAEVLTQPMTQTSINVQTRFEQKCPKRSEDIQERLNDGDLRSSFAQALTYIEEYFSESDEYKEYEDEDEDEKEDGDEDDG